MHREGSAGVVNFVSLGGGSCAGAFPYKLKCVVSLEPSSLFPGSAGVVSFMTPRIRVLMLRCGEGSHIVKIHCFFGGVLLYS